MPTLLLLPLPGNELIVNTLAVVTALAIEVGDVEGSIDEDGVEEVAGACEEEGVELDATVG